jgi:hypothetical protein
MPNQRKVPRLTFLFIDNETISYFGISKSRCALIEVNKESCKEMTLCIYLWYIDAAAFSKFQR